jgi:predicted nuclease with TOPRIM domain
LNDNFLEKLADSFDDFKERLIRIEENVKGVPEIKADVEGLKIQGAQTRESTKQSHKRIDDLEKKNDEREKEVKWLKRQIVIGFITFVFAVLAVFATK